MQIDSKFLLTKAKMDEAKASMLDPILSAHIAPHKFPVRAENIQYYHFAYQLVNLRIK